MIHKLIKRACSVIFLSIFACAALLAVPFSGETTTESAALTAVSAIASSWIPGFGPKPASDSFIDTAWYRSALIRSVDLWNGGLDGLSGMGAYAADFTGYFNVKLTRDWKPIRLMANTAVAHSRCVYMNVEAYRAAGPEAGARFLNVAVKGADFLLSYFWDKEYGGFYWEVSQSGEVKADYKQGYANVHPMFALAQVYAISGERRFLDAALKQLKLIEERFLAPSYAGAFLPGWSRTFSRTIGFNGIDPFTHYFEALLSLFDVTEGNERLWITDRLDEAGSFLIDQLCIDMEGYDDRAYLAYNYNENWLPSRKMYQRQTQWNDAAHATPGHGIEFAFLLSRAVERGFNPDWLDSAKKLLKFCEVYAINEKTGGMLYEITDYSGKALAGNPDNNYYLYWPSLESARAFLHWTLVRGADYGQAFKKLESLIHEKFTDQSYGGLWSRLRSRDLEPDVMYKGDVWKTNYHYAMFMAEALRLAARYP